MCQRANGRAAPLPSTVKAHQHHSPQEEPMSTTPDSTAPEAEGHGFKLHLTDEQADDDAEGHGFRHLVDEPGDDTQGHVTSGHKF